MIRKHNFSAGPAALPTAVLEQAQAEILDWQGKGLSVMEMSHRSAEYVSIANAAEQDLRDLLGVSDEYAVLFLQGGATSQFGMVPVNMMGDKRRASYINTGIWSEKAIKEAKRFGEVSVAASTESESYSRVPSQSELQIDRDAAYLHYTTNETIGGVQFDYIPDSQGLPLVSDMSSDILSGPIEVNKFDLIYAGAQKNIGPAGITVVIVRKSMLGNTLAGMPTMLNYQVHAKADSMNNTPPTYAWYLSGLVFKWLKDQGGLSAMATVNERKAAKLYAAIDASGFYANPVAVSNRSIMNVPFTLADPTLESKFLEEAFAADLLNLQGHRSVGGMRASIYNAVSEASVDALVSFMADFEKRWA